MLTRARRTGYRSQRVRITHLKNNQARFTDQRHDRNKAHTAPTWSTTLQQEHTALFANKFAKQGAPRSDQSTRLFPTQRRLGLQIAFCIRTMSTSSQPSSTRRVRARQKNFLAFCGIGMPNFPPWRAQSLPWGAGSPKLIQAKIHSCVEVGSSYIDHENTAGHGQGGWFSSRRSIYVLQIRRTKL